MLEFLLPLALFAIAAYDDMKKQKISDSTLSVLWVSLCILYPGGVAAAGYSFAFIYLLNTASFELKRQIFGWADVIMLPALFGFLWAYGMPWLAIAAPAGMLFTIHLKKSPVALAPFCLMTFVIGLALHFFILLLAP